MALITRSEEFLLLAVWRLQDEAYAVTIREQLKAATGKTWAFGALFVSLDRLEQKGYLASSLGEPTPERGGRRKRMYTITTEGLQALAEVKRAEKAIWAGVPELPAFSD
ncbi:MAG: PadR family transcriptional regulator [bacterium]